MFFLLRAKLQFVDVVDDLAEIVARLNLVLDLAEDLADLVFDGIRPARLLLEAVQVGEELAVDEVAEVIAGERLVVVDLPGGILRCGPGLPAVWLVEDMGVLLAVELGFVGLVFFEAVEIFQKKKPGSLFGVVEFARTTGLFPENVVDILEGLFKHGLGNFDWR